MNTTTTLRRSLGWSVEMRQNRKCLTIFGLWKPAISVFKAIVIIRHDSQRNLINSRNNTTQLGEPHGWPEDEMARTKREDEKGGRKEDEKRTKRGRKEDEKRTKRGRKEDEKRTKRGHSTFLTRVARPGSVGSRSDRMPYTQHSIAVHRRITKRLGGRATGRWSMG